MSTTDIPEGVAPDLDDSLLEFGESYAQGASLTTWIVATTVVLLGTFWAYFPEFQWLWGTWTTDPNYSHGFLVIPVAAVIFWRRASVGEGRRPFPVHWAWGLLIAILVVHSLLHQRGNRWASSVTMLGVLGCLCLTLGGTKLLRRAWPAIGFLIFMIPLSPSLNNLLAQPLQSLATSLSVAILRLTGLWVISEGNVILVGKNPLAVAEACNGLSMLMSLGATAIAAVLLVPISTWMRAVVLASVLPIALLSNVIRIAATAWAIQILGPDKGGTLAHDVAGWMMMPLALALVGLELAVLTWLFVEEETQMPPMLLGRPIVGRFEKARAEFEERKQPPAGLPSGEAGS